MGSSSDRAGRRRRWGPIALPAAVVLAAGALRLFRLDRPHRIYFDEAYYANDAHEYLRQGVESVRAVHPPLGKWLIAGGIEVFGFNPFGWRISAALAGTLTVLVVYACARRLFPDLWSAALAAVLLAVDGLAFTMSRIAMLDVFFALFVSLTFLSLLVHRDVRAGGGRGLRWLAATGLALGSAVATKWAGIVLVPAALVFVLVGEWVWARREGPARWRSMAGSVVLAAASLTVIPSAVYVASYASWFANVERTDAGRRLCAEGACPDGPVSTLAAWWGEQADILRFHRKLVPRHPDRSPAWGWPLLDRPVLYHFERCDAEARERPGGCAVAPGHRAKIVGLGNPAVWWPALAAYPVLAYAALRRRDWRAGALLLFLLAQWLPWLVSPTPGYFFYMTPVVTFVALSLAYLAERCARTRALRWVPAGLAVLAVASFAFFYPVYAAVEAPREELDLRMWNEGWR